MKAAKLNRLIHRWASLVVAVPICIIIVTGIMLQLKKDVAWIQPSTMSGSSQSLAISFDEILEATKTVPEAGIDSWDDIDRLDVRPDKGMLKVRGKNRWEVQIDTRTGDVLQVAYRRSDLIEDVHDGSFFNEKLKLWLFLPSGLILLGLWGTGLYLFALPHMTRRKRNRDNHDLNATS
jgi:uncharacterized iron-regulated membrane protein